MSRPHFTLKDLNLLCWALFAIILAAPMAIELEKRIQSGRALQEDRDFVFFYGMGRMLNEYPASQLYNYELQKKVAMEVHPLKAGREYTPNPYPPFVALLFRPFARLSYPVAYPLWLSITFSLYIVGLVLTSGSFFPHDFLHRSLIFCAALSFLPFWWIMTGGQIPIIGFFGFALAFREENRGRPLLSGLGLSLCLYKPTLLFLIVPMLLVTRRYRTLMGLAAGGLALGVVTTAVEGVGVWSGYLRMAISFGAAAADKHGYRVLHYYMDFPAFSSLLPGGRSWLGIAATLGCACWAAFSLFRAWWKYADAGKTATTLLWATTLTWTFVLNIYVPIYDSVIAVIGAIATAAVFAGLAGPASSPAVHDRVDADPGYLVVYRTNRRGNGISNLYSIVCAAWNHTADRLGQGRSFNAPDGSVRAGVLTDSQIPFAKPEQAQRAKWTGGEPLPISVRSHRIFWREIRRAGSGHRRISVTAAGWIFPELNWQARMLARSATSSRPATG